MRRRAFLGALGCVAAWPVAARAQQGERIRKIGVLMGYAESDPEARARLGVFQKALQVRGWVEGRNIKFEIRWAAADSWLRDKLAEELVKLAPDVIFSNTAPVTFALKNITTTIPIVFAAGADPVESGLVESLARPGGNITGFSVTEPSLGGKWLDLLMDIAPRTKRVAVIADPANPGLKLYLRAIDDVNVRHKIELSHISVKDAKQLGSAIDTFGKISGGALMVLPGAATGVHRINIVAAAARNQLPAIYPIRYMAAEGGLLSYGSEHIEPFRGSAAYVDRILRGEKPGELPIQQPTKFELTINVKTAKALGLDVPLSMQARADEVIE